MSIWECWKDPDAQNGSKQLAHIGGVLKKHGVDTSVATGTFRRGFCGTGGHPQCVEMSVLACAAHVSATYGDLSPASFSRLQVARSPPRVGFWEGGHMDHICGGQVQRQCRTAWAWLPAARH